MKQVKYNPEQIAQILKNEHIIKCSSKAITYSKAFKVLAIKQYNNGLTASQIFKSVGLEPWLVGEYVPRNCLVHWRKKFKEKGEVGLEIDERGSATGSKKGRPTTKGLTDAARIERLEIEVAYLKAKNDFLVKLRAQRKS